MLLVFCVLFFKVSSLPAKYFS